MEHDGNQAVNRLSHDILHYLFAVCLRTLVDQQNLPLILSHVCTSWRFTALKSPFLWTSIYMRCVRGRPHHSFVKLRLVRSKNLPLDFHINTVRPLEENELKNIILPFSRRFRKFSVVASSEFLIPLIFKDLRCDMPILEHFDFQVKGERHRARICIIRQPGLDSKDDVPFRLPPVRRNILDIIWADWQARNVTSLIIDYFPESVRPTINDLHIFFTHNQSTIERMEFRGYAPQVRPIMGDEDPDSLPVITLSALRSLTIGYVYPRNYVTLFYFLSLPNLTSLTLRDICRYCEENTPANLEELMIIPEPLNSSPLLSSFSHPASITHLACFGVQCDEAPCVEFMQTLTNLRSVILYDSERTFFNAICASFPAKPRSSSVPFAGQSLSRFLITNTTALAIAGYLTQRQQERLPPLEKFTFSEDCTLPPSLLTVLSEAFLSNLARQANLVTLIPVPHFTATYVPWEEYVLLSDGLVDRGIWDWYLKSEPEVL